MGVATLHGFQRSDLGAFVRSDLGMRNREEDENSSSSNSSSSTSGCVDLDCNSCYSGIADTLTITFAAAGDCACLNGWSTSIENFGVHGSDTNKWGTFFLGQPTTPCGCKMDILLTCLGSGDWRLECTFLRTDGIPGSCGGGSDDTQACCDPVASPFTIAFSMSFSGPGGGCDCTACAGSDTVTATVSE